MSDPDDEALENTKEELQRISEELDHKELRPDEDLTWEKTNFEDYDTDFDMDADYE